MRRRFRLEESVSEEAQQTNSGSAGNGDAKLGADCGGDVVAGGSIEGKEDSWSAIGALSSTPHQLT